MTLAEKFQLTYPAEKIDIIKSDDGYAGITSCNGVLCWWTDATTDYYEDTPENRNKLTIEFQQELKQREEEEV